MPAFHCLLEDDEACLALVICRAKTISALIDERESTPLHEAAFRGNLPMMKQLLDVGVSASAGNEHGWTALHAAADGGRLEAARLLLDYGAPPDPIWSWRSRSGARREQYGLGTTPLHLAVGAGSVEVARLLIEQKVDVNALQRSKTHDRIETPDEVFHRERLREITPLDLPQACCGEMQTLLLSASAVHGPTFTRAEPHYLQGRKLVRAKVLEAAVPEFEAALEIYPDYLVAAGRLARALALLSKGATAGTCDIEWARLARAAVERLLELERILELDEQVVRKILRHSDFDGLRGFDFFLTLQGVTFESAPSSEPFITGKVFRTSCPGSSFCPVRELSLHRNHRYTESNPSDPEGIEACLRSGDCVPSPARTSAEGTWRVEKRELFLQRPGAPLERLKVENESQVGDLYWPDPNDMGDPPPQDREGCALNYE